MPNKALLVDLDKTIRDTIEKDTHLTRLKTQFILPNRIEVLQHYKDEGYKIIAITNAGFRSDGLSPPHVSLESIAAIQKETEDLLGGLLDEVYYSPLGISPKRKPDPEMLQMAIKKYNIDKKQCIMVGDSWKDEEAAKAAGVKYMHPDEFFATERKVMANLKVWHRCIDSDRDLYETTIADTQPKGFYSSQTEAYGRIHSGETVQAALKLRNVLAECEKALPLLIKHGLKTEANTLALYAAEVGSPEVDIAPGLGSEIKDAVARIRSHYDPNFFSNVTKIDVLMGGPFGQVTSDDPTVVRVNFPKIKEEVRRQLDQAFHKKSVKFDSTNEEHQKIFDEALTRAVVEVVSHETGHVDDFRPKTDPVTKAPLGGDFPGGEAVADQQAQNVQQRLKDKP